MKASVVVAVSIVVLFASVAANAQGLCPAGVKSDKLICLLPQVYGENGLVLSNSGPGNAFQNSFLSASLTPLNSALSRQSALLPLVSPSSGITYSLDPSTQTPVRSTDSLGPILGERSETIGKYKMFLGFAYQYYKFDRLDGVSLKKMPVVFPQPDQIVEFPDGTKTCSLSPPDTIRNTGECAFIRDVIRTENRLDLKIHQFTTFITFGLTDRIDISLVIPIEQIRMGMFSNATIVDNANSGVDGIHTFPSDENCPFPCRNRLFTNVRAVSGLGDLTLRVKGTAWKGERAGLAMGADIRLPTGDALNFMGAGAAGVKPFVVWSYRYWMSPHVFVGYESNGSSLIAGDISTGSKVRLPSQLTYSGGADVQLTKRLTGAVDIVGQEVFETRTTSVTNFEELGKCRQKYPACAPPFDDRSNDDTLAQETASSNITNLSVGMKLKLSSSLVVTGNALIKLNDGGLRARIAPLIGLAYTF